LGRGAAASSGVAGAGGRSGLKGVGGIHRAAAAPLQCAMSTPPAARDTQAWQLYVELEDVRPKVWRRLLVPLTIDLSRLHVMLLWGTGWDGGHVHEFVFGHDHYGATEPGREFPDDLMPEEDVTLSEALGTRKSFKYPLRLRRQLVAQSEGREDRDAAGADRVRTVPRWRERLPA
jgi:Plasmid pRiA4b ORF-3-like protein